MKENLQEIKMPINPLDTIREETILLKLFDSIKGERRYVDIFKCISEQDKNIKQEIYENSANYIYKLFNYYKNDIIIVELNKILQSMKLKCTVDELPCKEVNERFKSNKELKVEWLKFEPSFICRKCKPSKIFETEDELRTHREESGHKSIKISRRIPKEDKRLTIIENNNYIYTPQLELIEYSGILAELNNKLISINLTCSVEKRLCRDEPVAMLRFEPTFICCYCRKIYDTEHELKECEKKCEKIKRGYLFSWDEIPGNDNGIFIEFLTQNFRIGWVKMAKIEKIDGKTIRVSTENNSLTLRLNDEKTKANLEIDNTKTAEYTVKEENGKLDIWRTENTGISEEEAEKRQKEREKIIKGLDKTK